MGIDKINMLLSNKRFTEAMGKSPACENIKVTEKVAEVIARKYKMHELYTNNTGMCTERLQEKVDLGLIDVSFEYAEGDGIGILNELSSAGLEFNKELFYVEGNLIYDANDYEASTAVGTASNAIEAGIDYECYQDYVEKMEEDD